MTRPAIEFDRVSKRYIIRHQKTAYLKDRLTDGLRRLNPLARESTVGRYEDFWALRDVSFQIEPGHSVGIVGPNGSGKSTTLKILSGVTSPTSGRSTLRGKLGALIEVGAGFHPELTGRENVFLNGSILGMRKAEIKRKFDAIVAFAEVEQFIDTPVKFYSSGMYVRLGFAIAIHNDPDILLVDEVLAVGDLAFQRKCFDKMKELKSSGRTFVLISHAMAHIQSLCDRAILLEKGRIIADGNTLEVTDLHTTHQRGVARASIAANPVPDNVVITSTRVLDRNGNTVEVLAPGQPFTVEFDFTTREPLANAIAWVQLQRGGTRILDLDSRSAGAKLPTLRGSGTIRCDVDAVPLMPNDYDLQVAIFDENVEMQASSAHGGLVKIGRPSRDSELGCAWISDADQRGCLFARGTWSNGVSSTGRTPLKVAAPVK